MLDSCATAIWVLRIYGNSFRRSIHAVSFLLPQTKYAPKGSFSFSLNSSWPWRAPSSVDRGVFVYTPLKTLLASRFPARAEGHASKQRSCGKCSVYLFPFRSPVFIFNIILLTTAARSGNIVFGFWIFLLSFLFLLFLFFCLLHFPSRAHHHQFSLYFNLAANVLPQRNWSLCKTDSTSVGSLAK